MKTYTLFLILFLFGCESIISAGKIVKTTERFIQNDMSWFLEYENIYFSGEIAGSENSVLHDIKSIEACKMFNENVLLNTMFEKKLFPHKVMCVPYDKNKKPTKGLLIKQTSDLSMIRQDYYYIEHINLSTGHIIYQQDIIQATYKDYSDLWLFNSILPLITASRQYYGNDLKWTEEFNLVCDSVGSKYC